MIAEIQAKFARDQFEFSKHATDRVILRRISVREVREAVAAGQVIEDYPHDKYGPTCLILGFTQAGRPLHIQCSYPSRSVIRVVTVYEPSSVEWVDLRVRRK
jgi:hypothetical protein